MVTSEAQTDYCVVTPGTRLPPLPRRLYFQERGSVYGTQGRQHRCVVCGVRGGHIVWPGYRAGDCAPQMDVRRLTGRSDVVGLMGPNGEVEEVERADVMGSGWVPPRREDMGGS